MALLALPQAEHGPGHNKSRMADSVVRTARGEARVARQGEGAAARWGAGDGGQHLFISEVWISMGDKKLYTEFMQELLLFQTHSRSRSHTITA